MLRYFHEALKGENPWKIVNKYLIIKDKIF